MLNKAKAQTIRPAFEYVRTGPKEKLLVEKPKRYSVQERVQLIWNQRSKNNYYCSNCFHGDPETIFPNDGCMNCGVAGVQHEFHKRLGEGIITEVFKIEMCIGNDAPLITGYHLKDTYELAKRDGFEPGENGKYTAFYDFFHKYDLFSKKPFWVYRWRWV